MPRLPSVILQLTRGRYMYIQYSVTLFYCTDITLVCSVYICCLFLKNAPITTSVFKSLEHKTRNLKLPFDNNSINHNWNHS